MQAGLPDYAELHCRSNFSFLSGASHAEELISRAARLGYRALAITDECSVAGVVRAHEAARHPRGERAPDDPGLLRLIIGSEFTLSPAAASGTRPPHPGGRLLLLVRNRAGYGQLCTLITLARSRCAKGDYRLDADDFDPAPSDCWALLLPRREDDLPTLLTQARWLVARFGERARIAIELLQHADDNLRIAHARAASQASGAPLVAAGDVLMHVRSRKPLADTLTAIRHHLPLADCGHLLMRNAEQHLRSRLALAQIYRPEWLAESVRIADACTFSLDELRYEYPDEIVPAGHSASSYLRQETLAGAARRYPPHSHPDGIPPGVLAQIEHELALVAEMRYEAFFLTVHDIVRQARRLGILCQGRGSAANSAVCYCLGITEVDPTQTTLLFERFISRERGEPPDIDVDFEHERREEIIQYIYAKYGRHRTALAAAVSTYRVRGALRDVGRAFGLDELLIDAVAKSYQWFDGRGALSERLAEQGLDAESPVTQQWLELATTLMGFPRHLSQHSGGFVIARESLSQLVPIEPAAMDGRQIIQWDKDDLESLGLLKVDVLALGMLTVLRKSLDLANAWHGRTAQAWRGGSGSFSHRAPQRPEREPWTLHHIPRDDPATYAMIRKADTVGMFQIESRAQQSMLPRLRPDKFYDLVIEVAIVRPGPIQGGMVHPYLRRKQGKERADSPYPALDAALARTLGVPIFQEQVMQVCMIAAGFSPGEADGLRRAMAAWRRKGGVHHFHERIVGGMVERGYERAFAEGIFRQIQGFGEYGFPESHAYSFAILAWFSAWLKCHEPAAFLAALLNSQPMGFYGPAQLVADARRHQVEVRPVDVTRSDWDCTLEAPSPAAAAPATDPPASARPPGSGAGGPAVRLGLRQVGGLSQASAERLLQARREAAFIDVHDLARRAALDPHELQTLARADALAALAGHRRQQVWAAAAPPAAPLTTGTGPGAGLLQDAPIREPQLSLIEAPEGEAVTLDYAATGLSLRRHPLALLRERLRRQAVKSAAELARVPDGRVVRACGLVVSRQQPGTAHGTVFVTLEDETGVVNLIVWQDVRERYRRALLESRLLAVRGTWQQRDGVAHLLAHDLFDISGWLGPLQTRSRDFH
ncbi:DNA polymerase III, alpha subunit [Leptothrix cholodnii SP-6]|uniref:Error-prone DNA polymerase n=1 Tax=Leptothrix cholodnii (strain ATCC 51168 / LMG 8142 / SP-6) TaxID=395495 RepID=B1XYC3_LEPCP|nr:error-prone DNA polymerase [Leptothrix cholodnii]ACB35168.1 DNA polymerase III, alpha subunit [Leptothrix cholodnii SP-6]